MRSHNIALKEYSTSNFFAIIDKNQNHPLLLTFKVNNFFSLQCCGSGMFILDPGSNNSTKRVGGKIFCPTSFCSYKYNKIVNIVYFWTGKENFLSQNTKNLLSYQKDMGLGSEIKDPEKTYSGSRIQGKKRHRIPDPQHWFLGSWHVFLLDLAGGWAAVPCRHQPGERPLPRLQIFRPQLQGWIAASLPLVRHSLNN